MISIIVFIIIINSGSFFAAAKNIGKYEEILPITNMLIVLCLYVAGLFGGLRYGVILVCMAAAGIYGYTVWLFIKGG